jgi:hypothetical protein
MAWRTLALLALGGGAACIVHRVEVRELPRSTDSVFVSTPVRAHLLDGQTVLYPQGVLVRHDSLIGAGRRYDLRLTPADAVDALPVDSVLGMESYRTGVDVASTVALSTLVTAGTAVLVGAAVVVISCINDPKCFGSCPTFYSDSARTPVLEAEGFSYSVAPLFEAQDVDRLRAGPGADDTLRLEVRNEAYETHYINRLALLEARHGAGEFVLPDAAGHLVAVREQVSAALARDAAGRDLRAVLRAADGDAVRSDRPGSLADTLELAFPVPADARDSAVLVFRMRNSLLNTVLLYEVMLGDAGARSLDWQGDTLQRIGPALELGRWYAAHLGMRIAVWRDGAWREVAHVHDTGPVAWKDIAAVIPRPPGDSLRVRLVSVADNWRIDRVTAAFGLRRPAARTLAAARATDALGHDLPDALAILRDPDRRYLETTAGQRFTIAWDVGEAPADSARTFFLLSQGYYIEWIRQGWLRQAGPRTVFTPSDSALARVVVRYRAERDTLERRFFATRVPVR